MSKSFPVDAEYPDITAKTLAFGSCHKNKSAKRNPPPIWDAISELKPDAFLWAGDLVYSPLKSGIASLETLKSEYDQLLLDEKIGYGNFLSKAESETDGYLKGGVHATWDDHDYGANDFGYEMPNREERKDLLLDFLGVDSEERRKRNGVYSAVSYGKAPQKTKVIFLDTRSGRSKHCIPSVGAVPLPFGLGSALACITRYFSSGLNLQKYVPRCRNGKVLDEEQWEWFEQHLLGSDAQVNIVVSSIQVLTTNPMMESWGQFPEERERFLKLLNKLEEGKSVVLLSGDVHHGEIMDSSLGVRRSVGRIIEVTSSGLTHRYVSLLSYPFGCIVFVHRSDAFVLVFKAARTHFTEDYVNHFLILSQATDFAMVSNQTTTRVKTLVPSISIGVTLLRKVNQRWKSTYTILWGTQYFPLVCFHFGLLKATWQMRKFQRFLGRSMVI